MTRLFVILDDIRAQCRRFVRTGVPLALILLCLFLPSLSSAADTFPANIPKTKGDLTVMVKAILQTDSAFLTGFKASSSLASAKMKIKNENVTLVAFKRPGLSKVLLAIIPENFKLSTFVPIPNGTPVDGLKMSNVALVYVPKGVGRTGVPTSGLPTALTKSFQGLGAKADFKDGLNVFGKASFQSVDAVKKLLSNLGHNQFDVPMSGNFSPDILRYDLKTSSQKLKEQLFDGLHLNLPLPKLKIPNISNIVSVESAHLAIVGKEVKGKRDVFAGVTGAMKVKVGDKWADFNYGILTGDKARLTGSSKDKVSLALFKPAEITNMKFSANRDSGKWVPGIAGKSNFNGKPYNVSVPLPESGLPELTYSANIPFEDVAGKTVPGLDKIKTNWIVLRKDSIRVDLNIKGIRTDMNLWKVSGSSKLYAGFGLGDFAPDKIIPDAHTTPLKDASFKGLTFVFNPTTKTTNFKVSQLPDEIGYHASTAHLSELNAKPGFNMFGHLETKSGGDVGKLLKHVGVNNPSVLFNGTISSKVLDKFDTQTIKNEVLDSIDLDLQIPKINVPDLSKVATVKSSFLSIKGKNTGGKRTVEVELAGQLDVKAAGQTLAFDYNVVIKKVSGKPDEIQFHGHTDPGKTLTVSLLEKITISDLTFLHSNHGNWAWQISGKSTFRSKSINVIYLPNHSVLASDYGKLSLSEIAGGPVLPALDNIEVGDFAMYKNFNRASMTIKGVFVAVDLWKPQGSSKLYSGFFMGDSSPDKYIPSTENAPFKDVSFKGVTFVNNPTTKAEKFARSGLADEVGYHLPTDFKAVTLKPGLNMFADMEASTSSELAKLLKEVGVTELKLPLSGAISPQVFAKSISGTTIKNEIIDSLDLDVSLPAISLPKMPNTMTIKSSRLSIKGTNVAGKRAIDAGVRGVLDVKAADQTLAFDYNVQIKKVSGKPDEVQIHGQTEPGKTLTVSLLEKYTVSDLSFIHRNRGNGAWQISGKTTIKSKPYNAIYLPNHSLLVSAYGKLSLSDVAGGSVLPVIDDLKVGDFSIYKNFIRVAIGIKGVVASLDLWKPEGSSKFYAGFLMGDSSPDKYIPGAENTPLKDVSFKGVTFVNNPTNEAQKFARSGLPDEVGYHLPPDFKAVTLKPGLNMFADIDAPPSGELAKLLKEVGITELKLQLNGGVSPQVFAKNINSAAIENEILDSLDLDIFLPAISLPKMPNTMTIKSSRLSIKGTNVAGKRAIDTGVRGVLDVKAADQTLAFDYDVEIKKVSGKPDEVQIHGHTEPGKTLTVSLSEKITISDLNFFHSNRDNKAWQISGKSSFRSKPLKVTYLPNHTVLANAEGHLSLSEVAGGPVLAVVDDIKVGPFSVYKDFTRVTIGIKGVIASLDLWKPQGSSKFYTGFLMGDSSPDKYIPGTENTPLKDVSLKGVTFINNPTNEVQKFARSGVVDEVGYHLPTDFKAVTLKPGLNVFGNMQVQASGAMEKLLEKAGIKKLSLPLTGTLSPKVFAKNIAATAVKNDILDHLDISATLPVPEALQMPGHVNLSPPGLEIKGIEKDDKREIDIAVTGQMNVEVQNQKVAFFYGVTTKKQAGKPDETVITGNTEAGKKITVDMLHKFTLEDMTLNMTKEDGKWSTRVAATTEFKSKPVKLTYVHKPDGDTYLDVTTNMTVASIVGDANLPGLDDVELDEIQIRKNFWRIGLELKGIKSAINLIKPAGASKYQIAMEMADFAPAKLIPGAEKTPLKDVTFKGMALVYSPDKTAKEVTLKDLGPDIEEHLKGTKEPLTLKPGLNVFGKADIHPQGEVAKLLDAVKITDLNLPLNGSFSPKTFAKNAASIKDEILSNLDVQLDLPQLALPGMPSAVLFKDTHLSITGTKKGSASGIDVDVSGELDVKIGSENVAFDYDVDIQKAAGGKTKITVNGESAADSKITADLVEKITITDLAFDANNDTGSWDWKVSGNTTFRSKPIEVDYQSDHTLLMTTQMTLADVIGQKGIPVLDDIKSNSISIKPGAIRVDMDIKGIKTDLDLWKPQGASSYYAGFVMADFSPAQLIPGAENSPLKDATFKGLVFVHSPVANTTDMRKGLPDDVSAGVAKIKGPILFKKGLNVFGHMDMTPAGEMASLLKKVGITEVSLPLNGRFSPQAFASNISGSKIKNAILDNLDIKMNLPIPKIAEMDKYLTFKNGLFTLKGTLPDGTRGIDVSVSGDADIKVKDDTFAFSVDVTYDRAQGGGNTDLIVTGKTDKKWTHPLGITLLDLDDLAVKVEKKKTGTDNIYDMTMTATSDVGSQSKLDIKIDIHEENGVVTDAFFELDGPLELSDIPGAKDIPNSSHFKIDSIKISEHGIEAKTDFGGQTDLDAFLFHGSGWNLIVRQDNFSVTELVPTLKDTPLKHVVLSETAIILSKDGLTGPLSGFSTIAQDALKDIYGAGAANIDIDSGLSLIAAFEHSKSKGGMAAAFSRLGLSDEKLILTGGIGGLFGGPTKLELDVDLSAHAGAKNQPKWMTSKPGVEAVFSMIATETAGQFDIEFGIGVDIIAKVHGTELDFTAKTALEFEDEKIDVKIVADLKDTKGWKKPFGIPGFTLYEVGFDLGIDEDAAIHIGFDGSIKVNGDNFKIAADADLLPEALGAPQDIAFIGTADKVDMLFMEAIAVDMLGGDFSLDIPGGILPTFSKVKFAFVTPGAQDPDLNITGEGFALKGAMNWLDHEVGDMDIAVNPTDGIFAEGKIDDISLGPLTMKKNDFHLKAGLKGVPSLKMDSDIDLLGVKETFHVKFDKTGVTFDALMVLGPDISMQSDFKLSGIDIGAKKPDFKNVDVSIAADLVMDIGKFIAGPAEQSIIDLTNSLDADFKKAEAALTVAQKKVDGLTVKINAERAKVRKEKAKAEAKVKSAENRVNGLNGKLDGQWRSYHHCHGWHKWPCRIREGISIGFTKTELRVADGALDLVRSLISHFPLDLDPRVAILIGERDSARGLLYIAKKAIEGADVVDKVMGLLTKELKKVLDSKTVRNSINIKKASFSADLQGIIKHDTPVDLAMDVELFGAEIKDSFSFKVKDIAYDVEQIGMLGLYAIEHLIEKLVDDIPGPLKSKLRGALATKMDAKDAARKRELAKYSKDFAAANKTTAALQKQYTAYNNAHLLAELAKTTSPLDSDTSETFTAEMIEVGHTGLCLRSAGGRVEQDKCADDVIGIRWSTAPVSGAPNTKAGSGYVNITTPGGADCIAPEGTWSNVKQSYVDPKNPTDGTFTFEERQFKGDGKITVGACINSKEYYWKVLKHGDGWMQMANLATNECLHFANSNAVPGKAVATWKSCTGAANQVYRVADDATPKYHHANIVLRSDKDALCFQNANVNGEVLAVQCQYAAYYDYLIDIRGYIKFVNRLSGKCLQPKNYKHGGELIERECSQLDYQWWNPVQVAGGWRMKNAQTSLCTSVTPNNTPMQMKTCSGFRTEMLVPLTDPKSGVVNVLKTAGAKPAHYNAAIAGTPEVGICAMSGMNGASWLPGSLLDGNCWVVLGGVEYKDRGPSQSYVQSVDGTAWVKPPTSGTFPPYAIASGTHVGIAEGGAGLGAAPAYTCRTRTTHTPSISRVGWTLDARTCHTEYYVNTSTDFEVLTRLPSKAYKIDLTN